MNRFFAVSQNMFDSTQAGHIFPTTLDIMKSLSAVGVKCCYAVGETVSAESYDEYCLVPVFTKKNSKKKALYKRVISRIVRKLSRENYAIDWINRSNLEEVLNYLIDCNAREDDIFYFPYIAISEAYWLTKELKKRMFCGQLVFYNWKSTVGNITRLTYRWYFRKDILLGKNVSVIMDTDRCVDTYNGYIGRPVIKLAPMMSYVEGYTKEKKRQEDFQIVFLGRAVADKGFFNLYDIAEKSLSFSKEKVQFCLQAGNSRGNEQVEKEVMRLKEMSENVKVFDCNLPKAEYNKLFMDADIVLLPYQKGFYRYGTSGPFAEALSAGVPTCVIMETWLSSVLIDYHNQACVTIANHDNVFEELDGKKAHVLMIKVFAEKKDNYLVDVVIEKNKSECKSYVLETDKRGDGYLLVYDSMAIESTYSVVQAKMRENDQDVDCDIEIIELNGLHAGETSYDLFGVSENEKSMPNTLLQQMINYNNVLKVYGFMRDKWNICNGAEAMSDFLIKR